MRRPDKNGFTLIELLIVVVIIGILAAIAIPKFSSTREKGYRAAMMSDLKNLAAQQEIYHNEHYTYSTNLTSLEAQQSAGVTMTVNTGTGTGWEATAVHLGVPGKTCGIYHGDATPSGGNPATAPGTVTCDF